VLTDEDGGVTERTTWGPWGTRLEGGVQSRMGFTGHQRDTESGLHHAQFRYLDSRNGRWTRRDPAGWVDGQNVYRYVTNNPGTFNDVMGLLTVGFAGFLEEPGWADGAEVTARALSSRVPGAYGFYYWRSINAAESFVRANAIAGEPIVIFGYSFGGTRAIQLAKRLESGGLQNPPCKLILATVDPVSPEGIGASLAGTATATVGTLLLGPGGVLGRVALSLALSSIGANVTISPHLNANAVSSNVSAAYNAYQRNGFLQGGVLSGNNVTNRDATNFDPAVGSAGFPWYGHGAIESSSSIRREVLDFVDRNLHSW